MNRTLFGAWLCFAKYQQRWNACLSQQNRHLRIGYDTFALRKQTVFSILHHVKTYFKVFTNRILCFYHYRNDDSLDSPAFQCIINFLDGGTFWVRRILTVVDLVSVPFRAKILLLCKNTPCKKSGALRSRIWTIWGSGRLRRPDKFRVFGSLCSFSKGKTAFKSLKTPKNSCLRRKI